MVVVVVVLQEFERRFQEFRACTTPFAVVVDDVSEELQMELLDLQCDTVLKQKYMDVGVSHFYKFLLREKFPNFSMPLLESWQCLAVHMFANSSSRQ